MSEQATIRFEPAGRTAMVPVGSTVSGAARLAGVEIDAPCGGLGRCGSCRVRAEGALEPPSLDEQELLGGAGIAAGMRLACRARVAGDAIVHVPERAGAMRIVTAALERSLTVEPPAARGVHATGPAVGAAVDLGTTTVAVMLVDLGSGEVLAVAADTNAQRAFGADVLSRVAHADASGGPALRKAAVDQIELLLGVALSRADVPADRLAEMVVVGNTAMTGLLLGADVSMLGAAPYKGAPVAEARVPAYSLGLPAFASLDVLVPPGVSAFVGSDITAGMLATGLAERETPTLLMDLGTNGELVLGHQGELLAASTAAGPALEGASISCGMRAEPGAIERVSLADGGLELGVIGEREPLGICGSGLLDLIAVLLDVGVLDVGGRFAKGAPGPLGERMTERDGVRAFVVDAHANIMLTQKDVRAVQLAIGAVRTGIELLLVEAGLAASGIESVLVAGGFGHHVRAESLVRLGLVPVAWHDRVVFAGNTALLGARMYLANSAVRRQAGELAQRVRTIDLAVHPLFSQRFLASLTFPG
ncbi:MAG: ASKHA domain-containing protein [Coriobacteriia bacterium]